MIVLKTAINEKFKEIFWGVALLKLSAFWLILPKISLSLAVPKQVYTPQNNLFVTEYHEGDWKSCLATKTWLSSSVFH